MDNLRKDDTQAAAKSLHRAVTAQANAKQQLAKVRSEREQYLQAWLSYVEQITDMLGTQIGEQEAILDGYAESELQWSQALHAATQDLSRRVADAPLDDPGTAEAVAEASAMADASMETAEKMEAEKQQYQASAAQLQKALQTIKAKSAERLESAKRDGSRTPRRQPPQVDLTGRNPLPQSNVWLVQAQMANLVDFPCPLVRPLPEPAGLAEA